MTDYYVIVYSDGTMNFWNNKPKQDHFQEGSRCFCVSESTSVAELVTHQIMDWDTVNNIALQKAQVW